MSQYPEEKTLPPYTLKYNARCKNLSLRITSRHGLVITLPPHMKESKALEFLHQKKNWVKKHLLAIQSKQQEQFELPTVIHFHALTKKYNVYYQPVASARSSLIEAPQHLTLIGDIQNIERCQHDLRAWVFKQAQNYLPLELNAQSERTGLIYSSVGIRQQQARWGSCSSKKRINLNAKLLFLPRSLMEYILIHELCHTVHFNHSIKFWRLVKQFYPEVDNARVALRNVSQYIPGWVDK